MKRKFAECAVIFFEDEGMALEESTTYQAIIRKARLTEARHILLELGQELFSPVDEGTLRTLNAIEDVRRVEELIKRIPKVGSWQELLQPTGRHRRRNRRRQS